MRYEKVHAYIEKHLVMLKPWDTRSGSEKLHRKTCWNVDITRLRSEVTDLGFEVKDFGFEVTNLGCKVRDLGSESRDFGSKVMDWDLRSRTSGLRS
ncbi:hypothetical protein LguiA_001895 [Lonicera macranthoides]